MSEHLIEKIIEKDFVLAEKILRDRLADIMEHKLFEMKKQVGAEMNEVWGGKTVAQAAADIRARGLKPRKAADVLGDPTVSKVIQKEPPRDISSVDPNRAKKYKSKSGAAYKIGYGIGKTIKGTGKVAKGAWGLWSNILQKGTQGPLE